jgi:DNA-binding PadR family transcriptional regulator
MPLTIEFALLGLIHEKPMHGYDLHKELQSLDGIALIWKIKQSQVYAVLDKLENEGLLFSRMVVGEVYPQRREFYLTAPGKEALKEWRETPVEHARDVRQEFLARLYFAEKCSQAAALALIARQERVCEGWLASLVEQLAALDENQRYERFVFHFRIEQIRGMLVWLDLCKRDLSHLPA